LNDIPAGTRAVQIDAAGAVAGQEVAGAGGTADEVSAAPVNYDAVVAIAQRVRARGADADVIALHHVAARVVNVNAIVLLPEITLRAAAVVPPIWLPRLFTQMPKLPLPRALAPVVSVPMKLPWMTFDTPFKTMPCAGKRLMASPSTVLNPEFNCNPTLPVAVDAPFNSTTGAPEYPGLRGGVNRHRIGHGPAARLTG
jgi:hypothetical protein